MQQRKLNRQSGMSLLEVLISMLILSFGLLGLGPLVVHTVRVNETSRDFSVAATLARDKMETIEGLNPLPALPHTETETALKGLYTRQTSLKDSTTDVTVPGGSCQVDVTISWNDEAGLARSTHFSTLVKKP